MNNRASQDSNNGEPHYFAPLSSTPHGRNPDEAALQALLSWAMPRHIEGQCEYLNQSAQIHNAAQPTDATKFKSDWNLAWSAIVPPNQIQATDTFNGSGYDMLALIAAQEIFVLEHKVVSLIEDGTKFCFESSNDQLNSLFLHESDDTPCYLCFQNPENAQGKTFYPSHKTAINQLSNVKLIRSRVVKEITDQYLKKQDGRTFHIPIADLQPGELQNLHSEINNRVFPSSQITRAGGTGGSKNGSDDGTIAITPKKVDALAALITQNGHVDNLTLFMASRNYVTVRSGSDIVLICKLVKLLESKLGLRGKIMLRRLSIALLENPLDLDDNLLAGYFQKFQGVLNNLFFILKTVEREFKTVLGVNRDEKAIAAARKSADALLLTSLDVDAITEELYSIGHDKDKNDALLPVTAMACKAFDKAISKAISKVGIDDIEKANLNELAGFSEWAQKNAQPITRSNKKRDRKV